MTRKEKRAATELRRQAVEAKLYEIMQNTVKAGNTLQEALAAGDDVINEMIKLNVRDKELILSAARRVSSDLAKTIAASRGEIEVH